VAFVPTGGIRPEDVGSWLDAGAACVGLGASLVGSAPPANDRELSALVRRVREAAEHTCAAQQRTTA
jgi:2-keto-3-deoxy-6-phosphogluconate aldolase